MDTKSHNRFQIFERLFVVIIDLISKTFEIWAFSVILPFLFANISFLLILYKILFVIIK